MRVACQGIFCTFLDEMSRKYWNFYLIWMVELSKGIKWVRFLEKAEKQEEPMIRFGLCCIFIDEPVVFRTTTAKILSTLTRSQQFERLGKICLSNAQSLLTAVNTVHRLGIGAFRISSTFFPRYTHPEVGYRLEDLPEADEILDILKQIKRFRKTHNIRLSFHPDQFVVLSSPNDEVVVRSLAEIEYQTLIAKAVGAEVINIHAGGAYGNKSESLSRFARNFQRLSADARKRLTLENDDVTYTVADLLPLCNELKIPLVYDVHHHRCNPDGFTEETATRHCVDTWFPRKQEPWFHLSSPKHGWGLDDPKPHADYIEPADIPTAWCDLSSFTIDVEAKAKERAVLKLKNDWPFENL